ncbi:hypothetical protein DSO57_1036659 [Entomophthora muscae]|uniref:Uncharacterized protein n=1 Tax=Entomophthora muscae TaxID=34485 RepID=A0ACC2RQ66_9FUNG|nr:hypothetical protein DSO57_1036659 [Entomophthora muscae]
MTPPLTPQPNRPIEPPTATKTMSTQLFEVLYITLTGMVDAMVLNSGPWSLLGQSVSYIIKLAPILWWALPTGPAVLCPKSTNASIYAWIPDTKVNKLSVLWLAVDQTDQDLVGWDSLLTTTEALVSHFLSLVSNWLIFKQGAIEIEFKPAAHSWFSGNCSVVASSNQSQDPSSRGSSQLQLAILNKPVKVDEVSVAPTPKSSLAMLQHIVPQSFCLSNLKSCPSFQSIVIILSP